MSRDLLQMKAVLTALEVPIKWNEEYRWKRAYNYDGALYDMFVGGGATKLVLSDPLLVRNETGKILQVRPRSVDEGLKIAKSLVPEYGPVPAITESVTNHSLNNLEFAVAFGTDIGRLCLKMCVAAATLLPEFDLRYVANARRELNSQDLTLKYAWRDGRTHSTIDERRPPLAHVIYLEFNQDRSYGVVQLFGSIQCYCLLGDAYAEAPRVALLSILDAVKGTETFDRVEPLGIPAPPIVLAVVDRQELEASWAGKLLEQAHFYGGAKGFRIETKIREPQRAPLFYSGTVDSYGAYSLSSSTTNHIALPNKTGKG